MGPVLERLVEFVIEKLVTPEYVKEIEVAVLKVLKGLAASTESKVDDVLVKAVADALGVEV